MKSKHDDFILRDHRDLITNKRHCCLSHFDYCRTMHVFLNIKQSRLSVTAVYQCIQCKRMTYENDEEPSPDEISAIRTCDR